MIKNDVDWTLEEGKENTIRYIAGLDISFLKSSNTDACAALVICSYPDYGVVYEAFKHVQLTLPYIPGFLAFREVPVRSQYSHVLGLGSAYFDIICLT